MDSARRQHAVEGVAVLSVEPSRQQGVTRRDVEQGGPEPVHLRLERGQERRGLRELADAVLGGQLPRAGGRDDERPEIADRAGSLSRSG